MLLFGFVIVVEAALMLSVGYAREGGGLKYDG